MPLLKRLAVVALMAVPGSALADPILLMAEAPGCYWCARWDTEIAPIYPKTAEGRTAPLERFNLHRDTPDVAFSQRVLYTPTFILVENGAEVGRIEGYPGADFFWGLLSDLFEKADIPIDQAG